MVKSAIICQEIEFPPEHKTLSGPSNSQKINSKMGYKELKKQHQDLNTELKTMEDWSREVTHKAEVERLITELKDCKETNGAMRNEIEAYKGMIAAKKLALDTLNSKLEEIKMENERMTAVLRTCRAEQKSAALRRSDSVIEKEKDLRRNNQAVLDHFLNRLESTVLRLKECNHDHSTQVSN